MDPEILKELRNLVRTDPTMYYWYLRGMVGLNWADQEGWDDDYLTVQLEAEYHHDAITFAARYLGVLSSRRGQKL